MPLIISGGKSLSMGKKGRIDSLGIRRGFPVALLIIFSAALLFQLLLFNIAGGVIEKGRGMENLPLMAKVVGNALGNRYRQSGGEGLKEYIWQIKRDFPGLMIKSYEGKNSFERFLEDMGLKKEEVGKFISGHPQSFVRKGSSMVAIPLGVDFGESPIVVMEMRSGLVPGVDRIFLVAAVTSLFYVLILYFFTIYVFKKQLFAPLSELMGVVGELERGNMSKRVEGLPGNELGLLGDTLNSALDNVEGKRKKMEEYLAALEKANEAIQSSREQVIKMEKMATIGHLASGIAHEVGNPLMAIKGYVEYILKNFEKEGEPRDCLERVLGESSRIEGIIKGLLAHSRMGVESDEEADMVSITEDILTSLSYRKLFEKIEIRKEYNGAPTVRVGPEKLRQVIMNVVINAVDAMEGGGELTLKVKMVEKDSLQSVHVRERRSTDPPEADFRRIRTAQGIVEQTGDPGYVMLEVTDTGTGIEAEDRDKIFDPFFTTKDPGKGTGLGLSVAQAIMASYGGYISFDPKKDGGSVFKIYAPVKDKPIGRDSR